MSNLEFDQYRASGNFKEDDDGFGKFLKKNIIKFSGGLVKTEKQADRVILGLVVFLFLITFFQIYRGFFRSI